MARLLIVLTLIGIACWYWSESYQNPANTPAVDDTKQNAEIMKRCIARENFGEAVGGYSVNAGSAGEDAEELCADEHGFFKMGGEWYHR